MFAYVALAAVCFFWGTTYIAIKMGLESFPPLVMISGRFIISGLLMLAITTLRGMPLPRGAELGWTALNGVLILGVGNGCLVFAEKWIPSSVAALIIAVSPFWMILLEAVVPGGERPHRSTFLGLILGFTGASILIGPSLRAEGVQGLLIQGFLILQFGCISWSLGSILQKRMKRSAHPVVSGGVQQLAAGLAFSLPAALSGNHQVEWSGRGVWAVAYLVVFGSIVGYSAYIYALEHLPIALVSLYTYVNPVVAAVLGWFFYREPFGQREILAMAVIFSGVTVVKLATPVRQVR